MDLPGTLHATTLGDVLGALCRSEVTGILELSTAGDSHRVHLVSGVGSRVESSAPVERLGEILHREGWLDGEGLALLLRRITADGSRRAGKVLIEDCHVKATAVALALQSQHRDRLEDLFSLTDARVSFHIADRVANVDAPRAMAPGDFLAGKMRARDRLQAVPDACQDPSAESAASAQPEHTGQRRDPARTRALEVLGLDANASQRDAKMAFRALAQVTHPDRSGPGDVSGRQARMRRFAELSEAYHRIVS